VQELFERDVHYLVPLYQRPYVWNEEQQWGPLWDDIRAMLDHQEEPAGAPIWSHFLGAVVLEQEQTGPGRIPRYTVIDGQQRLTTLQLLLAGAAAALDEVGAENDASLLAELTANNPRKAQGDERWKVWPTNANRAAFTAVMEALHSDGTSPATGSDSVSAAPVYFRKRAVEYLRGRRHRRRADGCRTLRACRAATDNSVRPPQGRLDHT
jgi:hypothetical protein